MSKSLWKKFIDLREFVTFLGDKQAKIAAAGKNPLFAKAANDAAVSSAKKTRHGDYQRMMHNKRATIEKSEQVPSFRKAAGMAELKSKHRTEKGDFVRSLSRRTKLIDAGKKAGI